MRKELLLGTEVAGVFLTDNDGGERVMVSSLSPNTDPDAEPVVTVLGLCDSCDEFVAGECPLSLPESWSDERSTSTSNLAIFTWRDSIDERSVARQSMLDGKNGSDAFGTDDEDDGIDDIDDTGTAGGRGMAEGKKLRCCFGQVPGRARHCSRQQKPLAAARLLVRPQVAAERWSKAGGTAPPPPTTPTCWDRGRRWDIDDAMLARTAADVEWTRATAGRRATLPTVA